MEDKLYGYKEQSEELERLRQWRLEQILKEAEDAENNRGQSNI